jgi:hypothetical protein
LAVPDLPTKQKTKPEENQEGFFNLIFMQWWHTHCVVTSQLSDELRFVEYISQGGKLWQEDFSYGFSEYRSA